MRTQIYDHRSGLKVVPNDIVADVKNIIWNINPALSKKTVSSLKESVRERLEKEGWTGEYRLDATSRITISSYLRGVGLCFQTGNVGRVSCDRIAKFAPTSLEDLKALRCLDEAQITLYGQDIIEIVSQVLNR